MTNAELITESIAEMNRQRESEARAKINACIKGIMAQQEIVKAAQKRLGELRTELAGITIEPVNAADVLA